MKELVEVCCNKDKVLRSVHYIYPIRIIGLCVAIMLFSNLGFSQGLYVSGSAGIGSYQMRMVKEFQSDIIQKSIVPFKVKGSPSPATYYEGTIGMDFGTYEMGIFANYNTFDGGLYYSENNFNIRYDQFFATKGIGILYTEKFLHSDLGYFFGSVSGMLNITNGYIDSDIRYNHHIERTHHNVSSYGFNAKVSAGFAFVQKKLSIKPEFGYLLNGLNSGLYAPDMPMQRFFVGNDELKTNWSGLRVGITLSYHLKGHKVLEKEELAPTDWKF